MTLPPGTLDRAAVDPARTRLTAAAAAAVTVGLGLGLRALATGSVAKYGGDALYTVLLLALVVSVAPRITPFRAAGSALAASCLVEFLQLTPVCTSHPAAPPTAYQNRSGGLKVEPRTRRATVLCRESSAGTALRSGGPGRPHGRRGRPSKPWGQRRHDSGR